MVFTNGKTIRFFNVPDAHMASTLQVLIMIQNVGFARQDIVKDLENVVECVPMEGILFMVRGIVGILARMVHTMMGVSRLVHCAQKGDITKIGVRKMKVLASLVQKENIQTIEGYVITLLLYNSFHSLKSKCSPGSLTLFCKKIFG